MVDPLLSPWRAVKEVQGVPPVKKGGEKRLRLVLELQGFPRDHLEHCPLTVDGAKRAVANGVPIQMGRAIAKAVRSALETL